MTPPTYLDEHRADRRPRPSAVRAPVRAARVTGLRIDPDGRLSEVRVPTADTRATMAVHLSTAMAIEVGVGLEVLDADLAMWFDEDGALNGARNPAASVVVAMFGRPGAMYGPVVFTGWIEPQRGLPVGAVGDLSVAATILLAGVAPSCDPHAGIVDRAAEFARLDVEIVPAPRAGSDPTSTQPAGSGDGGRGVPRAVPVDAGTSTVAEPGAETALEVSFDAQANTVTVDGDVARCATCGQEAAGFGHPEHQLEVLAHQ